MNWHKQPPCRLQTLAAYLLLEMSKGSRSRWGPYLEQLPTDYCTFFTWTAKDISALQVFCQSHGSTSCCRNHGISMR